MAVSAREQILANRATAPSTVIFIEDWDTNVLVKGMSAKSRAVVAKKINATDANDLDITELYADVLIGVAFDPEDKALALFTDEDRDMIAELSSRAVETIVTEGMTLSGIDTEAVEASKKASSQE